VNTIMDRPARSPWQRDLIERLAGSRAVFTPALIAAPFEEGFEVRFGRWQGHWRVDVSPRESCLNPSAINTEAIRAVLDHVRGSGWTSSGGDGTGGSVWVSGLLGKRPITLHVHLSVG